MLLVEFIIIYTWCMRKDSVATEKRGPAQYSYHSMFVAAADSAALWRCKSCGKEVSNRWHHYHSHTAQRSLCPYCPATYSRIDTLRSHLRNKHTALLLKH
ncbi:unnamed protein product [Danaus chrysippus]|uniref:Fruitless isoform B n=2 Tax=Danaus TaxID=13036 RepID=A0A212EMA6_DANPL|nr:fruitless isoform B [Danaus plexippus plexippus]CAG9579821.1 unnamed protein product [Danaus chrysippus]